MENLEATGAFTNVRPVEERIDEQPGMLVVERSKRVYVPAAGKPAAAAAEGDADDRSGSASSSRSAR